MTPPAWDLFLGCSILLVAVVVVLARRTATLLGQEDGPLSDLSRTAVYLNVGVSHGLVLLVLVGLHRWTGVPLRTLGLWTTPDWLLLAVLAPGLIALNAVSERVTRRFDDTENPLRELLTPENWLGWTVLLGGLLPLIAITEELLFRGVLIGAFGAITGLSSVVLVAVSAVTFGGAHTAQGRHGVAVATLLGAVLGAVYAMTGDLWVVVGAHYLVDLVEFVAHER